MTPIALISIVAVLLLVLMLRRTGREEAEQRSGAESRIGLPGTQIVRRIFSEEDREYISLMHSRRLQRMYQEERRRVALHWIRRISHEISRIMRTHRLNSRQSQDLHVAAEAKLFMQYLRLRFLCGLLLFLIYLFGPHAIQHLAFYAGELYQQIAGALAATGSAARATAQNVTTP